MILFVGSEEKGHFIREVAKSYQWNAAFVHPKLDIFSQVQEILQYPDCKVIVYDVEQYVMNAQEIAVEIRKIQLANNAVPVIYAPGYNPKSDLVMHLTYQGIKAYLFFGKGSTDIHRRHKAGGIYEDVSTHRKQFL